MLRAALLLTALSLLAAPPAGAARCTGSASCRACKTCEHCAHCAGGGGRCGVCAPARLPAPASPKRRSSRARKPPVPPRPAKKVSRFGPEVRPRTRDERAVFAAIKKSLGRYAAFHKVVSLRLTGDWAIGGVVDRAERTDGESTVCHRVGGEWRFVASGSAILSSLEEAGAKVPKRVLDQWFGPDR